MKQTKLQLKNKLKVLLIESKKSPVVSVQMWVKTGSADEKKGEEGISHFIEHLVFKGTEKFKVGEIANTVEASGGELNAYTSFDQTVFYVTISKNFSNVALDVVSQMMGFPTFDPNEIDSEREVVCEEIKMGQDSPNRRSSQLMFSAAFKKHPYGIPVIGYDKNVRKWSAKKIKDFYKSRYVPSNMFLVVSGDFETAEMKKKVEEYFGKFQNYKLKKVKRTKEPQQKKFQFKASKYQLQDQHLHFVFKVPNVRHKDVPALDVLAMILGQGDSSRLVKKLRLEQPITNSVGAFNYNPQDEGLFAVSAHYQGDRFDEIVNETFKIIGDLKNREVSWEEVKRARVAISAEQFYSIETVDGLANKAGTLEFYFNDQNAQEKYLKAINKIAPKDVMAAAKKYLKIEKMSAAYLGDLDEAISSQKLKSLPSLWSRAMVSGASPAAKKQKKTKIPKLVMKHGKSAGALKIEKLQRPSGMQVLFCPVTDTPTVSCKLVFKGGARLESPAQMGLAELTSRLWVTSTQKRSEEQLMQEIEESAVGLSSFTGKNTSGFSLDYLSVFENKAIELLEDCLLNTKFEEELIDREKHILEQAIKTRQDHPSSLCMRQFLREIFGDHPLSYEQTGTNESLKNIQRADLIEFKNRVTNPKNLVLCVVGDFNRKTWLEALERLEKGMSGHNRPFPAHPVLPLEKTKREFLESTKEQSHVMIGWRGLTFTSREKFVLETIEAILSGQGGRLFYELRDKNSLAYSVAPIKMESLETGYFGGYIACSHEKVEKAIEMFHIEFQKLINEKVGSEELARAKRYLIGQHDIGLQKKSAICNLLAFDVTYGNDYLESLNVAEEYNRVTADDIQGLAKKILSGPYVVSIVGKKTGAA